MPIAHETAQGSADQNLTNQTPVKKSGALAQFQQNRIVQALELAGAGVMLTGCLSGGGGNVVNSQADLVAPTILSVKNLVTNQTITPNPDGSISAALLGNESLILEVTFSEALKAGQQILPAGIDAQGNPTGAPTATPIAGVTVTYIHVPNSTATYDITLTPDNTFAQQHQNATATLIPLKFYNIGDTAQPTTNYAQFSVNATVSNVPAVPATMPTALDAASQASVSSTLPVIPMSQTYQIDTITNASGAAIAPVLNASGVLTTPTATLVAGTDPGTSMPTQTLRVDAPATGYVGDLKVLLRVIDPVKNLSSSTACVNINHIFALALPASLAPIATGDNGGGTPTTFAITAPVLNDANGVQIPYTVSGLPTADAAGTPVTWTVTQTGNTVNISTPSYRAGLVGAPPQQLTLTLTSSKATGSTAVPVNITAN